MADLYIHIGMTKTGTTSLQMTLYRSGDALRKQGAVYPDFKLRYKGVDVSRNAFWLSRNVYCEETASECFAKINHLAEEYPIIILSDEVLYNSVAYDRKFYRRLKKNLDPGITIKIIVYLRRQDEHMYSWWAQQVKSILHFDFDTMTFSEFLTTDTCRRKSSMLDYRRYLQAAISELGRENVLVRVYERGRFEGGSLYTDFFGTLGLKVNDEFVMPDHMVNRSLRGSVLEAKRYLNRIQAFQEQENWILPFLLNAQDKMEQEGILQEHNDFTNAERQTFLQAFAASNEWVAREMLGRSDGILFRNEIPADQTQALPYTAEEMADVYGYTILEILESLQETRQEMRQELRESHRELRDTKGSHAYRIGRTLTAPARAILKRKKEEDGNHG